VSEPNFEAAEPFDQGFDEAGFDQGGFDQGGFDQGGFEQAPQPYGATPFDQAAPAFTAPAPVEKQRLNVYTVMLFISMFSLIIGIIALTIQLKKYGVF
jgi:hypothetical protein